MTAATLLRSCPTVEITVVESPDVPVIGVGESTLGQFKLWARYVGIEEREFVPATDASFKLSIRFTDFNGVGTGSFHYPFGTPAIERGTYEPNDWFVADALGAGGNPSYARAMFPATALAERNRISGGSGGDLAPYDYNLDAAYHFDAVRFGAWLGQKHCVPEGVRRIEGTVKKVTGCGNGIDALIMDDGSEIAADLYVDCTGWRSLLIGGAMSEPFKSYRGILPNNKAWAARLPYTDKAAQLEPFTDCTALGNGWVWNTPLWSRIGSGYVYSDGYVSDDQALTEFIDHLRAKGIERPEDLSFRKLGMRIGIHERTWVKNVVAIGLSAGFIEPLESNGLLTIHEFALLLGETLARRSFNQWDRDAYNQRVSQLFDEFAAFVSFHYALSSRDDTEYWRDATERTRLSAGLDLGRASFSSYADSRLFSRRWNESAGGICVFAGMGHNHLPRPFLELEGTRTGLDFESLARRSSAFASDRYNRWARAAERSPRLIDFLRTYHE